MPHCCSITHSCSITHCCSRSLLHCRLKCEFASYVIAATHIASRVSSPRVWRTSPVDTGAGSQQIRKHLDHRIRPRVAGAWGWINLTHYPTRSYSIKVHFTHYPTRSLHQSLLYSLSNEKLAPKFTFLMIQREACIKVHLTHYATRCLHQRSYTEYCTKITERKQKIF